MTWKASSINLCETFFCKTLSAKIIKQIASEFLQNGNMLDVNSSTNENT